MQEAVSPPVPATRNTYNTNTEASLPNTARVIRIRKGLLMELELVVVK